jgi:hypothetical protein
MASVECLIGETIVRILNGNQSPARKVTLPSQPIAGGPQQERKNAMAYGLSPRVFIEDGPAANARRSTARAWRALDEARRLQLIERALTPANDCFNTYPLAL